MIALDTNVLAFLLRRPRRPRGRASAAAARRTMLGEEPLFVALTVVLELEWVMRGFYGIEPAAFCAAAEHLFGMPQATVDRWEAVKDAVDQHRVGFDFADALHLACSAHCERFVTFDDRGLARRARRAGLKPTVELAR